VREVHPQKIDQAVDGSEAEDGWHGALDIGGYSGQGYGNFSLGEGAGSDEEQHEGGSDEDENMSDGGEKDDDSSDDGY